MKTPRHIPALCAALALSVLSASVRLWAAAAPSPIATPVVVYQIGLTNNYPNFPELLALFAKHEPNVKIVSPPQSGGSGSTLARLKTEGKNTEISLVFFGQALGPQFREADLLQPIKPVDADRLRPTDRDPKGLYYSFALWTPTFIYNSDQIKNPPKSFADLLTAEGRLSYDNPTTSASGMIFLVGAILANGGTIQNPEPGFAYLKKLRSRIVTNPSSGGESLALVSKGEIGLAVHYSEPNMYNKYFQNAPINMVVPREGMPLSALSVGVSKFAPQAEAAKRFVDFLLSKEAQQLLAGRYFRPVRTDIVVPPEIKAKYPENYDADYPFDWDSILPYQKSWLDRWNREIK